jgi:hypothetical protein
MSTPTCLGVRHGRDGKGYTPDLVVAPPNEPRAWSGLLSDYLPRANRSELFRTRGFPESTVLVHSHQPVQIGAGSAKAYAYVGAYLPFEAVWTRATGSLRVDVHRVPEVTLILDLVLPGTVAVDCSRGGTYVAPPGSHLVAWAHRNPSHTQLVVLPLERHEASHVASLQLPHRTLAVAQVAPRVETLLHVVWSGGLQCISCGWTGDRAGLARHYGVDRFLSFPRELEWDKGGRAKAGRTLRIRTGLAGAAMARWKQQFLDESAKLGAVAWTVLPQQCPIELRRRLDAVRSRTNERVFTKVK